MSNTTLPVVPMVNLRGVGGLRTRDGDRIRPGVLYRSAAPFGLTAQAAADLVASLGLGVIVDLRSDGERAGVPWPELPAGVRLHAVELAAHAPQSQAPTWPDPFGPAEFGRWYAALAEAGADRLARLVRMLAYPETAPMLVHCTAGKDRTGIVVACVLDLLDVDDDTIVADYERTRGAMDQVRARTTAVLPGLADAAVPDVIMRADGATLRSCLAELRRAHGGFAPLLARHGLTAQHHEDLRARFLGGVPA
jgi:protein-tyrosine phosphatase